MTIDAMAKAPRLFLSWPGRRRRHEPACPAIMGFDYEWSVPDLPPCDRVERRRVVRAWRALPVEQWIYPIPMTHGAALMLNLAPCTVVAFRPPAMLHTPAPSHAAAARLAGAIADHLAECASHVVRYGREMPSGAQRVDLLARIAMTEQLDDVEVRAQRRRYLDLLDAQGELEERPRDDE